MLRVREKPSLWVRGLLVLALIGLAALDRNPLVLLEAKLGLSPSPIERLFGIKSFFSGMTEGVHQFVMLEWQRSFEANIFAPLVLPSFVALVVFWRVPVIDTRRKEAIFFAFFVVLSAFVNVFN